MSLSYTYFDYVWEANGWYHIKHVQSILSQFNYAYCGVDMLSMSNIIMNKVFDCANECNVKI